MQSDLQIVEDAFYRSKHELAKAQEALNRPADYYMESLSKPEMVEPVPVPGFLGNFLKGFGLGLLFQTLGLLPIGIVMSFFYDTNAPISQSPSLTIFANVIRPVIIILGYAYFISKALRPWIIAKNHNHTIKERYSVAMRGYSAALGPARTRAAELKHRADERLRGEIAALKHSEKGLDFERKRIKERLELRKREGLL